MCYDNVMIILQARMTSTRLPGKVMLPLCGMPVLLLMLKRLELYRDQIVIATTNDGSEEPIVALCEGEDYRFFRGHSTNVLDRYYGCARYFGADKSTVIVRLTSDCPVMEQGILECMLKQFLPSGYDYFSNVGERTFPRGMDVEMFRFSVLENAYQNATESFEKEHVTPYIYKSRSGQFQIANFSNEYDHSRYRLTLDEPRDYEMLKALYAAFDCRYDFSYFELMDLLESRPDIVAMNQDVEQKHL